MEVARIGELVRRQRKALDLNQQDLGEMFGINQSSVAKWERGAKPAASHLPKIAKFLDLPLEAVLAIYHEAPEASFTEAVEEIRLTVASLDRRMAELTHRVIALATPAQAPADRRDAPGQRRRRREVQAAR